MKFDVLNCLFPLDVQNEIQLLSGVFWKKLSTGFWSCALQRHYQWNQCEKKITWPSFSRNCKGYWSDTFLTALPSEVRDFKSGRALPYISRICMCSPKGKGFCAVGLKKRVKTLPIWVWNRVWFSRELVGVYERIHCFNSKWFRKKEKYANSKWIWRNLFCSCSNLSNDEKNS